MVGLSGFNSDSVNSCNRTVQLFVVTRISHGLRHDNEMTCLNDHSYFTVKRIRNDYVISFNKNINDFPTENRIRVTYP